MAAQDDLWAALESFALPEITARMLPEPLKEQDVLKPAPAVPVPRGFPGRQLQDPCGARAIVVRSCRSLAWLERITRNHGTMSLISPAAGAAATLAGCLAETDDMIATLCTGYTFHYAAAADASLLAASTMMSAIHAGVDAGSTSRAARAGRSVASSAARYSLFGAAAPPVTPSFPSLGLPTDSHSARTQTASERPASHTLPLAESVRILGPLPNPTSRQKRGRPPPQQDSAKLVWDGSRSSTAGARDGHSTAGARARAAEAVRGGAVTWAEAMLSAADRFLASRIVSSPASSPGASGCHAVYAAGKHGSAMLLWESSPAPGTDASTAEDGSTAAAAEPCGVLWSRSRQAAEAVLEAHAVEFRAEDVSSLLTSTSNIRPQSPPRTDGRPMKRTAVVFGARTLPSGQELGRATSPDIPAVVSGAREDDTLVQSDLAAYRASMGAETSILARTEGSERSRRVGAFFVVRGRPNVLALASALVHSVCTDGRVLGGSSDGHKLPHISSTLPFEHGASFSARASCRKLAGADGGWMAVLSPLPPMQARHIAAAMALRQLLGSKLKRVSEATAASASSPPPVTEQNLQDLLSVRTLWAAPGPRVLRRTALDMFERCPVVAAGDPTASAAAAARQIERGACTPSVALGVHTPASTLVQATLAARFQLVSEEGGGETRRAAKPRNGRAKYNKEAAGEEGIASSNDDGNDPDVGFADADAFDAPGPADEDEDEDADDEAWLAKLLDEDGETEPETVEVGAVASAPESRPPVVGAVQLDSHLTQLLAEHGLRWKCVSER